MRDDVDDGMGDDEQRALAAQLACPHGEQAQVVGEHMNAVNAAIVDRSIAALSPRAGETVVEIGPANGILSAPLVTVLGAHGRYLGLERSSAMAAEAQAFLGGCSETPVEVRIADCLAVELPAGSVDAVLAVNLLYFIDDPAVLFRRIRGWLRPGGRAVFGVRSEATLRTIACTRFGFHLHGLQDLAGALARSGFIAVATRRYEEPVPGARDAAAGEFLVIRGSI